MNRGSEKILKDGAKRTPGVKYVYEHIAKIDGRDKCYYHPDPLGSPLVTTKQTVFGASIAKQYKYKAFGALKYEYGQYTNTHKFTGKELDETGLYYFGARYKLGDVTREKES